MITKNDFKSFAPAGSKPHYNPDRPGKVEHISLDLKIDFDNETVLGKAVITLNPLRKKLQTLEINAVEMQINRVIINTQEAKFDYDGEKIFVYLNQPSQIDQKLNIEIDYKLEKPKMGITFVKPTTDYPDKPVQLWTQGESEQSRYWYPCFDYPLQICTSEIKVELPKIYTTISNGLLQNQIELGDNRVDHWVQDQPHPNYLMALTAGEFVEIKDTYKDIQVNYYTQKKYQQMLALTAKNTPKMIEFFSSKFGVEYPWKKYSQTWIHDYIWGGMENTTTTFNTERALVDEKAAKDYDFAEILVAHELAHQWFGDYIVIEHWSHLWVKEGAATFSEYLWNRELRGEDDFNYYKLLETREYLDEDSSTYRRPIVTSFFRETEDLYDRHSYSKGGLVYNMIRAELGEELFEIALKHFLTENKHKNVDSYIFLNSIAESTGKNLKPLFDQYVFRGGHPDFKVSFNWDNENKLGKLSITQKQAGSDTDHENLFNLQIPVNFGYVNKENKKVTFTNSKIKIDKKEQTFYFPLSEKPDFISFDPENNYLKTVELNFSMTELKNQLKFDPDVVNRIYAASALAKKGNLEALKSLADSLENDPFWAVRAEVATEIGKIKLDQTVKVLIKGLEDTDPRVKKNVIDSLSKFYTPEVFKTIFDIAKNGDTSYFVEKSAIQAVGTIAAKLKNECLEQSLYLFDEVLKHREGWNEVVRSGAISGLAQLNFSQKALTTLLDYAKPGVSQYLRITAISMLGQACKKQSKENVETVIDFLNDVSQDNFIMTERAVVTSLGQIDSSKVIPILSNIANKTLYGRIRNLAEETIRNVLENIGSGKSISQIKEEVEEIKRENQKLKSRVEELEVKKKNNK